MEQNISGLKIDAIQYIYMQFRHFNTEFKWDIKIWCQGCEFMHCLCDAKQGPRRAQFFFFLREMGGGGLRFFF
jgi:hypothetical protein